MYNTCTIEYTVQCTAEGVEQEVLRHGARRTTKYHIPRGAEKYHIPRGAEKYHILRRAKKYHIPRGAEKYHILRRAEKYHILRRAEKRPHSALHAAWTKTTCHTRMTKLCRHNGQESGSTIYNTFHTALGLGGVEMAS